MKTAETDKTLMTFQEMTAQVGMHLSRLISFPLNWGVSQPGLEQPDMRPRLFRYDAQRFRRLIIRAEHMIRCLIIWLAYRKMRDTSIVPANSAPMPNGGASRRPPQDPVHPEFALRGLPLYEPKAPVFNISMPSEVLREESAANAPRRNRRKPSRRPRNDDIGAHERLYLQFERLETLFDSIDERATRLAARWAGLLTRPEPDKTSPGDPYRRCSRPRPPPTLQPLKCYSLPPDLTSDASVEETEDLTLLHDAAYRAAEAFPDLCG